MSFDRTKIHERAIDLDSNMIIERAMADDSARVERASHSLRQEQDTRASQTPR